MRQTRCFHSRRVLIRSALYYSEYVRRYFPFVGLRRDRQLHEDAGENLLLRHEARLAFGFPGDRL